MTQEAPDTSQWLTTAEVAFILKVSERTIQRRCEAGKLVCKRHTDENGEAWRVSAASVPGALVSPVVTTGDDRKTPPGDEVATTAHTQYERESPESGATLTTGDDADDNVTTSVVTTDDSKFEAVAGEVHQLRSEIEQLKGVLVGGMLAQVNERLAKLDELPSADDRRAEMAQAVREGITEALQASTAQQAEREAQTASKDDVRAILDELKRVQDTNARLSGELEQLREARQGRGFWARLFGG
jgi:hypothetical protein